MDSTLRAKIDKHLISAQAVLYRTIDGGRFEIMPEWVRGYSGVKIPVFNIFRPLTADSLNDDLLADTEAFFSSRRSHYVIELIHDLIPAGPDYLNKLRYQPLPPQPAMYLTHLPSKLEANAQVQVERVRTVPAHTAFFTLLHTVFDFELRDVVKLFPVAHLKEEHSSTIRHYLAFFNDEPVATGMLVCKGDVASVWHVCTIDHYRRQRIATTMLYQMLQDARSDGFEIAMLFSTAQAYHLFNRFGFELYTQRQWFLPPNVSYEE